MTLFGKGSDDRFTMPREVGGHRFEHDSFNHRVRCLHCNAFITDAQILDDEGSLQEAAARLLNALGPCDQINRVRGRVAGAWKVEA